MKAIFLILVIITSRIVRDNCFFLRRGIVHQVADRLVLLRLVRGLPVYLLRVLGLMVRYRPWDQVLMLFSWLPRAMVVLRVG